MNIGGAERALYQLIRGQVSSGIQPQLLVLTEGGFYAKKTADLGVNVHELHQRSAMDLQSGRRFEEIAGSFDVVHFQTQSPWLMRRAKRLANVTHTYTHRGGSHRHGLKRRLMYWCTGRILRNYFGQMSGNTQHAANVAAELFGIPRERFVVTYNGIDFDLLQPDRSATEQWKTIAASDKSDSFVIGTSANLRNWKRIDLLIRAVQKISDPLVHCLVIGDGQARKALEDLTKTLSVANQVTFVGVQENVANYLQLLDAFVLPSNDGESFGNSAVEAMGLGIPTVVMSDCGGMREHFPESLRDFPRNVDELTDRIVRISADREAATRSATICQEYVVQKYTIKNMVSGYQQLYERLAA